MRPVSAWRRRTAAGLAWVGAVALGILLLGGQVVPVRADASTGLTLQLTRRWNLTARPGTWSPYVVTVQNSGTGTFTGEVELIPLSTYQTPDAGSFPSYRAPVTVAAGSERRTVIQVVETYGGYRAELHDGAGRVLARANPDSAIGGQAAVAILSDLPNAAPRIEAPFRTFSGAIVAFSRFTSASDFPASAVQLSGLNGVILDQFDSGALSGDQLQALTDFVGLGGTLIEAGGASGARTLRALPPTLVPMTPAASPGPLAEVPLAPLAELGGMASDAAAQVVSGQVASWARTAVAAPDGTPLVVEGAYGAGEVVQLAFDPLAPPFDAQASLAALAWSQAITRGLSAAQGSSVSSGPFVIRQPAAMLAGSGPGAPASYAPYLSRALGDAPAADAPPYGLLVGLLIGYGLVVSVLSGLALRLTGRSGLLWVTVPALAVACTAAAYLFGFASRGSDYRLVQVQVQRLAPGGTVETDSFDGVLSPRRGDLRVTLPAGTLVSTAAPFSGPSPITAGGTVVTAGPRPEVLLANVAVWDLRTVTTVGVSHDAAGPPASGMPIDARLSLSQGRIHGQVTNRTSRTVRDLRIVSASGASASLVPALAPGAAVAVDAAMTQGTPLPPAGKGPVPVPAGPGPVGPGPYPGGVPPANAGQALLTMAAAGAASRAGELVLVGLADPTGSLSIEGRRPARTARAVVVEPVRLDAADSLAHLTPAGRLVSSFAMGGAGALEVYEIDLPPGLTGHQRLNWSLVPGAQSVGRVEVYDWSQRAWRPVSPASPQLAAGEVASQVVRVRVQASQPGTTTFWMDDRP